MILLFPYDLPNYLPLLITSFVRHSSNQFVKETIMKTIQDFKRTHQDRWNEFQLQFAKRTGLMQRNKQQLYYHAK